jgi:hypothetical protein
MRPSPSIIPSDRLDRDIYLVLEEFSSAAAWRETDEDGTDYATVIDDLLTGPVRHAAAGRCIQSSRRLVARRLRAGGGRAVAADR